MEFLTEVSVAKPDPTWTLTHCVGRMLNLHCLGNEKLSTPSEIVVPVDSVLIRCRTFPSIAICLYTDSFAISKFLSPSSFDVDRVIQDQDPEAKRTTPSKLSRVVCVHCKTLLWDKKGEIARVSFFGKVSDPKHVVSVLSDGNSDEKKQAALVAGLEAAFRDVGHDMIFGPPDEYGRVSGVYDPDEMRLFIPKVENTELWLSIFKSSGDTDYYYMQYYIAGIFGEDWNLDLQRAMEQDVEKRLAMLDHGAPLVKKVEA